MKIIKSLVKFIIILFILTIFFNFLEYGFSWEGADKFIYSIALAVMAGVNFFIPYSRRYFLLAAYALLAIMVIFYLINQLPLSEAVGSFGFAILLIVMVSYLPTLIKKGYLERF